MLIRIIYVSRALSKLPLELKDILTASRKNNPALAVTGCLCFIDGVYLQYLEGEEAVVDALYRKIETDPRHTAPKVLERHPVSQRAFPQWAMALLTWNEETQSVYRRFNPDKAMDAYTADPATVNSLVLAWATTRNWMTL